MSAGRGGPEKRGGRGPRSRSGWAQAVTVTVISAATARDAIAVRLARRRTMVPVFSALFVHCTAVSFASR
ncbi:hypothetical protein Sxan_02170 [Streptomyces xanthophaeus]|uniref:Uncharacterized protein n=1 Tax=Streptomyces xanthophaeus TaxID=67385 RepID=A0A919GXA4_9ACTN|nr:hypothetical protein Sxan_02170 [Streptomyces xanthophaeus]